MRPEFFVVSSWATLSGLVSHWQRRHAVLEYRSPSMVEPTFVELNGVH